jgi:hypothetical protein
MSMLFKKLFTKKAVCLFTFAIFCGFNGYNKHMYDREVYARMNFLLQNKTKLSGVYLQQRHPFGSLWYLQWLLPYHQSLKIVNEDGTFRQVGLGRTHNETFNFQSEFILHKGGNYDKLAELEMSIPIEAWLDYKKKYGHYPENINVNILNQKTLTREEAGPDVPIFTVIFGTPGRDLSDKFIFNTCRSAAMNKIRETELENEIKE